MPEKRPSTQATFLIGCALGALLTASSALAEDVAVGDPSPTTDKSSYWKEHFSLFGYLSLGYADLDTDAGQRLADEAILGLEEDGSFPYGHGALHLRFDPTKKHTFILQLAARDLGDSPVDDIEDDIELDWLFYQLQITERTRLRVGRQPAPAGIFNELRDVGVLLPFFRPAFTFYREGALFSETIDGVGISHRFLADKPWSLDVDAYYGEFTVLEQGGGFDERITEVDVTGALGTQLWLNTPVEGLRLGLGALRWDVGAESAFNLEKTTWKSWYASVDGAFERFVARAELRRLEVDVVPITSPLPVALGVDLYYLQLGWNATQKLGFFVQPEFTDIEQTSPAFVGGSTRSRDRRDIGFSAVYQFRPNLVLKGEIHDVASEQPVGNEFIFGPGGPAVRVLYDTFDSEYTIVSLSVSF